MLTKPEVEIRATHDRFDPKIFIIQLASVTKSVTVPPDLLQSLSAIVAPLSVDIHHALVCF